MEKTKHKFEIPKEVKNISRILTTAGFENYLVGGCVRDLAMSKTPRDWDLTTNAPPEKIVELFPKTFYENDYGTVGIVNENTEDESLRVVEVTPFRLESSYSDSRHPDKVSWAKTIEEDLARRDFTMNAVAYDISNEKLIDPYSGIQDIENKLIKAVGNPEERFREDALRMLRALRFASELNFALELETQNAISQCSTLMENISRERVRDEFIKIIMSDTPALALDLAARLGILKYISPEFEKGIGVEQNKAHAYTVWEHILRSLNHAAKSKFPLYVRLAALLHDVAKPHTRSWKNNQWTFYGHEVVGARLARQILSDLRFPTDIIEKTVKLVRWHMFFSDTETITLSAVRRIIRNVTPELIWDLMDTRKADRVGTGRPKETTYRLRKYQSMIEEAMRDPISAKSLAIDGGAIMKLTGETPGPNIGFILEILLAEILEDPKLNEKDYLEKRVKELHGLKTGELKKLGEEARNKNSLEEEKEISKIRDDYRVK